MNGTTTSLQSPVRVSGRRARRRRPCSNCRSKRKLSAAWISRLAWSISGPSPASDGANEPMKCCTGALSPT
eukprot:8808151-Lingulodinium_polyedra.AAC.1